MNDSAPSKRNQLSVLIVDDDEAMRRSVRRVLQLDGYQIDTAGSGRETSRASPHEREGILEIDH